MPPIKPNGAATRLSAVWGLEAAKVLRACRMSFLTIRVNFVPVAEAPQGHNTGPEIEDLAPLNACQNQGRARHYQLYTEGSCKEGSD
jgi:hypothetical protein